MMKNWRSLRASFIYPFQWFCILFTPLTNFRPISKSAELPLLRLLALPIIATATFFTIFFAKDFKLYEERLRNVALLVGFV